MRSLVVAAIVLAALGVAACGGSGSDSSSSSTVQTASGPTGTSSRTGAAAGEGRAGTDGASSNGQRISTSRRVSFLERSFFGARSQVTYFVQKPGSSPLDQAKACVRENAGKAPSAYCFAFTSERAFRYSKISRRPPSKMQRPCWSAYWAKPHNRREFGSGENPAAHALRCPGS